MHVAVAAKGGNLKIQIARRFLVGHDAVIILLVLIFVQVRGIEVAGNPLPAEFHGVLPSGAVPTGKPGVSGTWKSL